MSERLRLALVGPLPPPNGGMAMQTLQLARLLRERDIEVEVLQVNAPYKPRWLGGIRGVRAIFRLVPYMYRVVRMSGRVDIVHLMANSGWSWQLFAAPVIWICHLRGTPVIVNYRGGEAASYLSRSSKRIRPTLHRAAALVVPSGFLKDVFGEYGFESEVIPNIIDLASFEYTLKDKHKSLYKIVITRNLEPIYGLETAIHAFALIRRRFPGVQLHIAGSGPQRGKLERLAEEESVADGVVFEGRLDREQIQALYAEADLMINPTTIDNMPNSLLEAMASGVPIVSTDVGGVPYIVEHEKTSLLVPAGDPEEMSRQVLRLLEQPELGQGLAKNAHQQVQQYSWDQVAPLWLGLYRQLGAK